MRYISFLFLLLSVLFAGCSGDDTNEQAQTVVPGDGQYFNLKVNGTDLSFDTTNIYSPNNYRFSIKGNVFTLAAHFGPNHLLINFDKNGKFLGANLDVPSVYDVFIGYDSYENFPSNYFNLRILSLDENAKRIKVSFFGKLYRFEDDLNSESFDIESGEFDLKYEGDETAYSGIIFNYSHDNCSANFNGTPWVATKEYYGVFSTDDPYKLLIHFAPGMSPGTFNFSFPSSSATYVKLYKFNTSTLIYDEYEVTGQIAFTYKENHGANDYTYFGTFNCTAVNPENSADTIQITNGKFISYQVG